MPEPDREAYEAAERLVREAHAKAEEAARAAAAQAPPNGWATPKSESPTPDFNALFALIDAAKGTLPPELLRQLADALRELLIALRAVIDYSIQKLEQPVPEARDVEDIPIT
jgi:ABC-type transporter Mla subunit MlaD